MRFLAAALFFFGVAASYGQTPEVPHKMQFAGMTLTIQDDARREIQADVDALTRSPKYFMLKVERAKTYFPIIEKIFAEERVPDDFKYLSLQESALVSDAVSVSNAVGFWQFKDFTAMEMGMRVDKEIDERMNLISASRGAARYLKQNNYFFNNWIYALQSYQMGAGGVQRAVGDQHNGATHMDITSDTYWYVKKYLAHKVAFEGAVQGEGLVKVIPYEIKSGKTLKEVSLEVSAEEGKLIEYNKWVKNGIIPTDKAYTVLIPVGSIDENFTRLAITPTAAVSKAEPGASAKESKESLPSAATKDINGLPVIYATAGETVVQLAQRGQVDLGDFIKYNEIAIDQPVLAGDVFFLAKKKSKAIENFYTVKPGDNLWRISQLYGVTIKKLEKYNRISSDQKLAIGTEVWLSEMKPKEASLQPVEAIVQLDAETFDWAVKDKTGSNELELKKDIPSETITIVVDPTEDKVPYREIQTPSGSAGTHVVQKGDTFYSIAKLYSLEVVDLLTINQLKIQDGLKVGQILKISGEEPVVIVPESATEVAPQVLHTVLHEVKISDTLYSIARQYQVTIKEIMDWNGKNDFALTIGEKLKIVQQ